MFGTPCRFRPLRLAGSVIREKGYSMSCPWEIVNVMGRVPAIDAPVVCKSY